MAVEFKIKCIYELCHHHRNLETGRWKSSFKIKGVITPDSHHIQENYSSTLTTQMRQSTAQSNLDGKPTLTQKSHFGQAVFLCRVHILYKKEDHIFSIFCHIFFILFFLLWRKCFVEVNPDVWTSSVSDSNICWLCCSFVPLMDVQIHILPGP